MTNRTQLVTGEIDDGTVPAAWLVKPDSGPEAVMIMWPDEPTSVSPRHYGDVVARVTRLLALPSSPATPRPDPSVGFPGAALASRVLVAASRAA